MRLYFAAGRDCAIEVGSENVLVSFAFKDSAPAKYWIRMSREERADAMRLYLAGNGKQKGSSERDYDAGVRERLLSYAFVDDWAKQEFEYWVGQRPPHSHVLLDSGAFSAWRLGTPIDLGEYCEYVQEHRAALDAYIVLDVIRQPPSATRANLLEMRRRGLDPLPVYHSDCEPLSVWEEILAENTGYVCLGGLAVQRPHNDELRARLNRCWRMVEKHWPVKVHGLGVMTQWMVEQYPFFSVDSASAIMGAGMGRVIRFAGDGIFRVDGWRGDVARYWDGSVVDGIGRVAGTGGRKSDSAHAGRRLANIKAQLQLERYVTDLWASKGVTWE